MNINREIFGLLLTQSQLSRDVVRHLQRGECCLSIAGLVHVAFERSCAVGVDLVDCYGEHAAGLHSCHAPCCELVLGLFADVNVSGDFSAAAAVDDVLGDLIVPDDGGVLLARGDGGTVAGDVGIDYNGVRGIEESRGTK